jgi:hypothetical protein
VTFCYPFKVALGYICRFNRFICHFTILSATFSFYLPLPDFIGHFFHFICRLPNYLPLFHFICHFPILSATSRFYLPLSATYLPLCHFICHSPVTANNSPHKAQKKPGILPAWLTLLHLLLLRRYRT